MKVSLNIINRLINIADLSPEEIAEKLTYAGVKVEGIDELAIGKGLTTGLVKYVESMPDSDHLHLVKVDCGQYGLLDIVCGAPNVRDGLKVIVALDGALLRDGKIKRGTIRGHLSEGMICSLAELGLDKKFLKEEDVAGIMELPADTPIGIEDVLSYLHLRHTILDLELLADRSDLYSLINVAKEIGTLFNRPVDLSKINDFHFQRIADNFTVDSLTPKCSQFSTTVIKDIVVAPSPDWLRFALASEGVRSINNIVDIGNLIMLLTGQPLHMYDLDKLPKDELIVRDDFEGDFVALDEKTYKLQKGDLVVTSGGRVMCLGGIMGSLECAVDENSKNIVIEAANFDFSSIRRTSIRLSLVSDSSQRFVKGINPHQLEFVQNLSARYLLELADAKKIGQIHLYDVIKHEPLLINTSVERINKLLGTSFSSDEIVDALTRDGFKIKESGGKISAIPPLYRNDLYEECDVVEEVIRLLGFDKIASSLPYTNLKCGFYHQNVLEKLRVRDYLRGLGLDDILTYSLVDKDKIEHYQLLDGREPLAILNPLTDDHKYVRLNLLPSLMDVAIYNSYRGERDLAFFEVSDLYHGVDMKTTHLGILLSGGDRRRHSLENNSYSFYSIKGVIEGLLEHFGYIASRVKFISFADANNELHPGRSAKLLVDNQLVGILGEIHPRIKRQLNLLPRQRIYVAEVDLGKLFAMKTGSRKVQPITKFPILDRDYSFIISKDINYDEIISALYRLDRKLIRKIEIFDLYEGEFLSEDKRSLALRVYFSSNDKTLTDNDIQPIIEKIISTMRDKFAAELRQ